MVLFSYSHSESHSEKHSTYNSTGKVINEVIRLFENYQSLQFNFYIFSPFLHDILSFKIISFVIPPFLLHFAPSKPFHIPLLPLFSNSCPFSLFLHTSIFIYVYIISISMLISVYLTCLVCVTVTCMYMLTWLTICYGITSQCAHTLRRVFLPFLCITQLPVVLSMIKSSWAFPPSFWHIYCCPCSANVQAFIQVRLQKCSFWHSQKMQSNK